MDPEFRLKITGVREETPFDTSNYQKQANPVLAEYGNVKTAENEKEELLLELFPSVATAFLKKQKQEKFATQNPDNTEKEKQKETKPEAVVTGKKVESPMPGSILKILVQEGENVTKNQNVIVLEAMKMENNIVTDYTGKVKRIFVCEGDTVQAGKLMMEIEV